MGVMQAQAFADAVGDEEIGLRVALEWHLTTNHYPPLPIEYVDVAERCIKFANTMDQQDPETWDLSVLLPKGLRVLPREARFVDVNDEEVAYCRLGTLIEILHLDSFIDWQEV